jgi:hypothetical protein
MSSAVSHDVPAWAHNIELEVVNPKWPISFRKKFPFCFEALLTEEKGGTDLPRADISFKLLKAQRLSWLAIIVAANPDLLHWSFT